MDNSFQQKNINNRAFSTSLKNFEGGIANLALKLSHKAQIGP
jgi:hypothetical protein